MCCIKEISCANQLKIWERSCKSSKYEGFGYGLLIKNCKLSLMKDVFKFLRPIRLGEKTMTRLVLSREGVNLTKRDSFEHNYGQRLASSPNTHNEKKMNTCFQLKLESGRCKEEIEREGFKLNTALQSLFSNDLNYRTCLECEKHPNYPEIPPVTLRWESARKQMEILPMY